MFVVNVALYIIGFVFVWYGAGLVVAAVSKFSRKLRLSPFAFSFLFLGFLTSIPELSVGLQAVARRDPEVFVGNLLGGNVVLFLFVIPLLAVFGRGISLKHEFEPKVLFTTFIVIFAPSLYVLDKRVTNPEAALLVLLYVILILLIQIKSGIFDRESTKMLDTKAYSLKDILKMLAGVGIVFVASSVIVQKTLYFADVFNISAFYVSLIVVSLGTNLPELSIAVRSVISGKKEIAMGDYMGSAAANTLLFGVLSLLHNGEVLTISNFIVTFVITLVALLLFYLFFYTKKSISPRDGLFLLMLYMAFVILELL